VSGAIIESNPRVRKPEKDAVLRRSSVPNRNNYIILLRGIIKVRWGVAHWEVYDDRGNAVRQGNNIYDFGVTAETRDNH